MSNTNNLYLVPAPIEIHYEHLNNENSELFNKEFSLFEQSDNDPIGQWLKSAKARGDARDSDPLVLTLIAELHRKVDELTQLIKGNEENSIELKFSRNIESINYEYFYLEDHILEPNAEYYGRVLMPTFPRRDIPLYFKAINPQLALIKKIHDRDRRDWDTYVAARERTLIRELKRSKNNDGT